MEVFGQAETGQARLHWPMRFVVIVVVVFDVVVDVFTRLFI